ncbi:unnamed protein product [Rotaria sp. Silwood2]|nr:unnamed protein product [Rotaria sp. Silwood2]CAF2472625.1 unnamed protein product [Rotaria sp. Silwood2]CAF2708382.1 unnamed protein product [Rotaria sp. Silwood2]CAF2857467.1 unnamed protein product [Rotaria sp. Silwood2]CAF3901471.1 unnamed protein product [Rotaria sp. Silwood2]
MQLTRILSIVFFLGLFLTIVLSDSTQLDINNDDQALNYDNHIISQRSIFGHKHRHHDGQPRRCVRCKFSLIRCCSPNICVKKHFRADKCLRVKT